jgi:hypothetical protein
VFKVSPSRTRTVVAVAVGCRASPDTNAPDFCNSSEKAQYSPMMALVSASDIDSHTLGSS